MLDDVISVIKGDIPEQPMISLWKHFPNADRHLDTLVDATLKDYKQFPSDILKLAPHGRFAVVDFGCEISPSSTEKGSTGATSCKNCMIKSPSDWDKIEKIDPYDGELGWNIKFVETMKKKLPDVPMMMTIFSPTMVAQKLSKNQFVKHYTQEKNEGIEEAFKILNDIFVEFTSACIDAGAEGIFAALQELDESKFNSNEIDKMIKLNEPFMQVVNKKAQFSILHLHGEKVDFEKAVNKFKLDAVNWHDQTSGPVITEARKYFKGGMFAGLDPEGLMSGDIPSNFNQLKELSTKIPLILAPGCVLLQGTDTNLLYNIFSKYKKMN